MKIEITDNKKWHQSLTIKMILLGFLGLFLLVPLELIKSIIKERQNTYETVKKDIALQWAGEQQIAGPVLNIPVIISPSGKDATPYRSVFHIMPEEFNLTGDIDTEIRYRSIYKAVVYNSNLRFSGTFLINEFICDEKCNILWNEAYYTLGISDNRGLKGEVEFISNKTNLIAKPGIIETDLFRTGISFPVKLDSSDNTIAFDVKFNLSGSGSIQIAPVGKTSKVRLQSQWKSPGFQGNFLPTERIINDLGFEASWLVTNLNRNFPQSWLGNQYSPVDDSFGVSFILPVDHYQKSLRSAKYGVLFIALTFMALLFAELTIKDKIHIFHYFLVSLSLILFFSMLNALSEHTGFNIAYIISSVSTISLISFFLNSLIKERKPVLMISTLLVSLYLFIYILMTLNDYAYLIGNLALFILLAITMNLSVKLKLFHNEASRNNR